jgi:hypothetical protein
MPISVAALRDNAHSQIPGESGAGMPYLHRDLVGVHDADFLAQSGRGRGEKPTKI